jgi:hypothetical protein
MHSAGSRFMNTAFSLVPFACKRHNTLIMNRWKFREVLDCASPLALSVALGRPQIGRGLPHSKMLARRSKDRSVCGRNARS